MLEAGLIFFISVLYLGFLFMIAHYGDRYADKWRGTRLRPAVYALSMAVYCTSWTFFGSVGTATTGGWSFIAIYVGPVLMILAGYRMMNKMAQIARTQNITSIADFIGARYGKSQSLAALVTGLAVVGSLAYITLQMQAVSFSFDVLVGHYQGGMDFAIQGVPVFSDTTFYVAILMAVFSILFGVRYIHASESHIGMMLAISFESIVKLFAFIAVGVFVTFHMYDGLGHLLEAARSAPPVREVFEQDLVTPGWVSNTILAALAIFCLPRQFHVGFVENDDDRNLPTAAVLFPLYLIAINLFVVPVAMAGMLLPELAGTDADLYVLTLPLSQGRELLAVIAFLGGLSAATSMVIVATVALSTMVSNELVMPLLLRHRRFQNRAGINMSGLVLLIRRVSIVVIILLAYAYYQWFGERFALASIGLLAFTAVAQFAPPIVAAIYWRRATRRGARWALLGGSAMWVYTLVLPRFVFVGWLPQSFLDQGPFGLSGLRPEALLGSEGLDPVTHGMIWSLGVNIALLVLGTLTGKQGLTQRRQARAYVDVYKLREGAEHEIWLGQTTNAQLKELAARFLGYGWAERAFATYFTQRAEVFDPNAKADAQTASFTEHLLSGAIGSASARVVMALLLPEKAMSRRDAMELLDEASEAIKFNRDLLLKTLDNISQGVGVFDKDLRLATWNQRFLDLLDMPDHLAKVTTPLSDLVVYSRMSGKSAVDIDMLLARNLSPQMRRLPHGYERRRADGTVLEIRTNPMPDGGFVATISDITARVSTEQALRESERNIRIYTDNVPVMIAYADRSERLRFTNRPYERALGLSRTQAQGLLVRDAQTRERYRLIAPYIREVLRGRRQTFEAQFPPNDLGILYAEGTYIPHFDDRGEVIGYFCIYTDITERRQAAAALRDANEGLERRVQERTRELEQLNLQLALAKGQAERANESKTRFFAAASHDLLQPLNAARLFAVALAGRDDLGVEPAGLVEKIDLSLKGVEELLNELLDICKLDAGAMAPDIRDFPLERLLKTLNVEFAPIAEKRGLTLRVRPSDAWVRSDSRLLRRILQNLISNALRYTKTGGVLVGCRKRGDRLRIDIFDTGPGIPEDKIQLIWQEFHRLDGADSTDSKGLGLGLAIVERMGRTLGHAVTVTSRVDRGTVFSVSVPVAEARTVDPALESRAKIQATGDLAGKRVLCIDNERDILDGMRAMLENWGCRVLTALTPAEAQAALAAQADLPDIILADYHLAQDVTGIEVMEALKHDYGDRFKGILITADRGLSTSAQAAELGYDLLNKPIKPGKLRALMTKVIQTKQGETDVAG